LEDDMTIYVFSENNSGGYWWLGRKQYEDLFAAGWKYISSEYDIKNKYDKESFFGPPDVPYGWRHGLQIEVDSLREAVESWEAATSMNFFEEGCNCCGAPFKIHTAKYGAKYECISGDSVEHRPIRPW